MASIGTPIRRLREKWAAFPLEAKSSMSHAVCSILQRCMKFLTLPLFTRLLTTEEYGQYTVYTSWMVLLTIFITLEMANSSFAAAMAKYPGRRDEYIAAVEEISFVLAFLFLAVYLPFQDQWNRLFHLPTGMMLVMVVEILSDFFISCWLGRNRYEYRYKTAFSVSLTIAICSPLLSLLLVLTMPYKGYARILGNSIVIFLLGAILCIRSFSGGKGRFSRDLIAFALSFNFPLIPYHLSRMICNQSDMIMIDHICGKADSGIYGVGYSLSVMLTFALDAITNSYLPWFYGRLNTDRQRENRRVSFGLSLLMAALLLVVIALAPEVIAIVAPPDYRGAIWIVPPVTMSVLLMFYAKFPINIEFYFEEKKGLLYGTVTAAVVNLILNALLIPVFGFIAAGYTTLFSYLVMAGMHVVIGKRLLRRKGIADDMFDYKALLLLLLLFAAAAFGLMLLYDHFFIRAALLLLAFAAAWLCRKKLLGLFFQKS